MLRPSYTDLLDVISQETDDITLGSRYTYLLLQRQNALDSWLTTQIPW